MKLVRRYDYQPNVSAQTEMTPEGFLKVMARATRTGVLKYKQMDGTIIRELRHPDEVFKAESMATLALKPLTNNHPSSLLDSETASMHMVGSTGETVKIDAGKYLEVMTVITDKKTIQDAENGKVEVSPGYTCELDFTPGTFDGEAYDAIQRNIRYNHLAVVKKGRSGPEVRLRLDADDAIQVDLNQNQERKKMKIKLDGKEFEVADDVVSAMETEMKNRARSVSEEMDAAKKDSKKKIEELEKDKQKAEAKADAFEAEIAKMKKERTDAAPADLRKAVKERVALEKIAEAVGIEKFDEMDDMAVKRAVIKADSPDANLEGKSDDYVNARFDIAAESIAGADKTAKKIGASIVDKTKTSEVMDADSARAKMIERQRNQWKKTDKAEGKEE